MPITVNPPQASPPPCPQCGGSRPWRWIDEPYCRFVGLSEPGWTLGLCPACREAEEAAFRLSLREALARARQAEIDGQLEAAGVPPRVAHATFDNYECYDPRQPSVVTRCRRFAEAFPEERRRGTWLLLSGKRGTGKGHLAAAIARTVMAQGFTVLMIDYPDLLDAIRDTYREPDTSTRALLKTVREVELLILDELGRGWGSPDEQRRLWQILNGRYKMVRPLLVLTNLKYSELAGVLEDTLVDRFQDDPNEVLVFDWESYRRRRREASR